MYIKNVELTRFKSFGSTVSIPLMTGFTVVSGPNGSGKSNILDALLFALGLAGSKGMRADRLPDLVNQAHSKKGRMVEAIVTVTFALDETEVAAFQTEGIEVPTAEGKEIGEWTVMRKLRVTSQGTYTSTYYINGTPCNLSELHEQLAKFRIYPEGYNVVLQGDVTGIISMNSRERREIIDELAGVGEFDRKISTAKDKLDDVKTQEERFRIVEQELIANKDKLKSDRVKAEKYKALRLEYEQMEAAESVLKQREILYNQSLRNVELVNNKEQCGNLEKSLTELSQVIEVGTVHLNELNDRVHTLGEEEYLSVSSNLSSQQAELRGLQRQQQSLTSSYQNNQTHIVKTQEEIDRLLREAEELESQKQFKEESVITTEKARDQQASIVSQYRKEVQAIASASSDWVRQQTQLRHDIDKLQGELDPQKQEQTRLKEVLNQRSLQLESQDRELQEILAGEGRYAVDMLSNQSLEDALRLQEAEVNGAEILVQTLAKNLAEAQLEVQLQNETIERLTQEQRVKTRQLDKLEAQVQASREVQGTRASQVVIEADMSGVYGLVAQLGLVEPRFQLALEICAGGRLGNLVVENDEVAAEAISLLKRERAGRATFLPLNKLQAARFPSRIEAQKLGAIDYAFNLVTYEDRYQDVFSFVFGNTLVFETLDQARFHIGKYRMVTLEGEILETSGAMTGGSVIQQNSLHFGNAKPAESSETKQLRDRLMEIDQMLTRLNQRLRGALTGIAKYEEQLQSARTNHREAQLKRDRIYEQIERNSRDRSRLQDRIQQTRAAIEIGQAQLISLDGNAAELEAQLMVKRAELTELEKSSTHSRWLQAQDALQGQEALLNSAEIELRTAKQQLGELENQHKLALEKMAQRQTRLQELRSTQAELINSTSQIQHQLKQTETAIASYQSRLEVLEQTIGAAKQERDACERSLRAQQQQQQQMQWQMQKNHERQAELELQIAQFAEQLSQIELPDPIPEVPETMTLEQLQLEQRRLLKRIQSMEPVNMMAIAEYEATSQRLDELSTRLETLNQERTELLIRIENFTTLRQRAFMQAFDAVNGHFKEIFAELSDGDGYLQLENPNAPLSGGLTLVAHPKGKQVQHLASMSGGEKSLTALSFIFALQRYRPSPFYAFDEVDMFLDGSNVERLSKMVRKQANLAQFIVVSLRRPMIEASERTIGVTQARGEHTQVLGLELRSG
ncbi:MULTISPECIES: chromosome segregation protein SMC [Pseudanabaena]|uniref:Chromosome partition protein Smc n=2 Tax=Pseudanabaena TaxID=1152 RepID=L8N4M9_9CYAN|nr:MULTISPECIES: chromosome segregation protein SMC [Pseudanabaena]ELS34621.1 condensin subunit Smc [Pseudanabaena biceps PCC 7429]MDG3493143.1 chromosome segregation protein SMC [Pseudanabaena catenata USMAC16]